MLAPAMLAEKDSRIAELDDDAAVEQKDWLQEEKAWA